MKSEGRADKIWEFLSETGDFWPIGFRCSRHDTACDAGLVHGLDDLALSTEKSWILKVIVDVNHECLAISSAAAFS
jgi:hypothetical protein